MARATLPGTSHVVEFHYDPSSQSYVTYVDDTLYRSRAARGAARLFYQDRFDVLGCSCAVSALWLGGLFERIQLRVVSTSDPLPAR